MTLLRLLTRACMTLALVGVAGLSHAELLVYEPFDYTIGSDVLGQGGTDGGFTGAWRENSAGSVPAGSFTVAAGSLAHPSAALTTAGNSAILTGEFGTLQPARDFPEILGSDGTSTWYSYIGQRLGEATTTANPFPRGVNAGLFNSQHATRTERVGIGNSSNAAADEWSIIPEGSGGLRVGSGVPFSELHWAVLRIDHHGDGTVGDDFYLWLDPDPAVEPSTASADASIVGGVDASDLDFIRPFVGGVSGDSPFGVLAMDELRIGTTYADMSSTQVIPEPATLALLALSGLGLGIRRRK